MTRCVYSLVIFFLILCTMNIPGEEKITGVWILEKYTTDEYTQRTFMNEVIVVFCPDGRYLYNPFTTPMDEQLNEYETKCSCILYYNINPKTGIKEKNPYAKYRVIVDKKGYIVLRLIEVDGREPKPYELAEYTYKKAPKRGKYKKAYKYCEVQKD
ncbi:MAG: hypothetical protein JW737_04330 [Acidobacteria bacterium]|nr:hypothetical protein [Acidobacteriota bacterium]